MGNLKIIPITLRSANAFVGATHRHHGASRGCRFALGLSDGELHGVAIAGRPVARNLDDGFTLEITRLSTDGTRNACSMLYGAVVRVARAMGYTRVITYTLASEPGSSLTGSGFEQAGFVRGRSWSCPSRLRQDKHPTVDKLRWDKCWLRDTTATPSANPIHHYD